MVNEVRIKLTDEQKAKIKAATGKDVPEIEVGSIGGNAAVAAKLSTKVAPKLSTKMAPKLSTKMAPKLSTKMAPKLSTKVAPKLSS